jgi:hypothetical protein
MPPEVPPMTPPTIRSESLIPWANVPAPGPVPAPEQSIVEKTPLISEKPWAVKALS